MSVVSGLQTEFERIVSEYEQKAYALSLMLTENESQAEEVMLEAFSNVLKQIPEGYLDIQESLYRFIVQAAEKLVQEAATAPQELRVTQAASLDQSIRFLPYEYRQVFVLHDMFSVSLSSMAETLSISTRECRKRLFRARAMTHRHLQDVSKEFSMQNKQITEEGRLHPIEFPL